ncbi:hypothetical protein [Arthrobacter rhizosphaerae]|uniref:hypothetical protein n=1 Tax=Arthrobacter rhizosphaerae TaxID=2855490 RepID=UPI001FF59A9D|nr:hypothetical protein [Arthrobacter rhizosphaerae]
MTPSPATAASTLVAQSAPAQWWEIVAALGPLAVLLAAVAAAVVGLLTLRQKAQADAFALAQKSEADSRSEWWRRTQWAMDRALGSEDDVKALGLAALSVLSESELAREEELRLLDIAWKSVIERDEDLEVRPARTSAAKIGVSAQGSDQRVRAAAAKLRVALDRRLGRHTPKSIKDLAEQDFR